MSAPQTLDWRRAIFLRRASSRFYGASQGLQASRIAGDCLRPWLLPGDVVLSDSTLDPVDGELVLVNMKFRRQRVSAGCMTVGGGTIFQLERVIKQLIIVDDVQYLSCASGAVSAAEHEILGPVVAWSRRGWRRAPMKDMDFRRVAQAAVEAAAQSAHRRIGAR